MDWGIKVLAGKWKEEKIKKAIKIVSGLIERYDSKILAIKKLHPARRTENLRRLANKIGGIAWRRGLKVCIYSIKELEKIIIKNEKMNKLNLFKKLAGKFPLLHRDLGKEQKITNPYSYRMFEALALAAASL